jgi:hypothetical protein
LVRVAAASAVLTAVSASLGAACDDRTGGDQPMPDSGRQVVPAEGGETAPDPPPPPAIAPRGGGWGGVARVSASTIALPSATPPLATTTDAIAVGAIGGDAGAGAIRLLTGGGSNLPADLVLVTP